MDHRQPLLELLARHRESRRLMVAELSALQRLVDFVTSTPECFERSHLAGHVTGSAWILDHARERCLLTHHKKLNLWLQPGGHADGDPDIVRVASREAAEESGISDLLLASGEIFDVDVHAIPETKKEPAHHHYDVRFLFVAPPGAEFVVSEESHQLAWVPRVEVPRYTQDVSTLRLAEKWTLG